MMTLSSLLVSETVRYEVDARARNPDFWFGMENVWRYPYLTICLRVTVRSLLVSETLRYELDARARNPGFWFGMEIFW